MQVEFKNQEQDVIALMKSYPLGKRLWMVLAPQVFLSLSVLPSILLCVLVGYTTLAVTFFVIIYAIFFLLMLITIRNMLVVNYKIRIPEGSQIIRLTVDFFEVVSDQGRSRRSWNRIHRAVEMESHLVLFINNFRAYIIPKTAFENQQSMQAFLKFVEDRVRFAQENPEQVPDMRNFIEDFALPWNEEKPLEVTYRVDRDIWTRVEFYGTGQENYVRRPTVRGLVMNLLNLFFFPAFLFLIASFLDQGQDTESFMPWVISLFVLVFVTLAIFNLINWVRYFRWKETIPDYMSEEVTSRITSHGLNNLSKSIISWGHWKMMDAISYDEQIIAIHDFAPFINTLIPKASFASEAASNEFLEAINQLHEQALSQAEDEDIILAEVAETGNPYQTPYTE